MDYDFSAKKLIIQVESLLKLKYEYNILNEMAEVPTYDLVIDKTR
jgi:hypothetical protein